MSNKKLTCPECKSDNIELTEKKGSFSTYKSIECKNEFDIRVFIQISLSKEEKDKIKEFAKKTHNSMSKFCKEAIFKRIEDLEKPEEKQTNNISQINPALIEQLTKNTQKMLELQQLTLERTSIMNGMKNTLEVLLKQSTKPDQESKDLVISLFKAHNSLNPKEIRDKTNLDEETIFNIIAELHEENFIQLTSRGRYKLNE